MDDGREKRQMRAVESAQRAARRHALLAQDNQLKDFMAKLEQADVGEMQDAINKNVADPQLRAVLKRMLAALAMLASR